MAKNPRDAMPGRVRREQLLSGTLALGALTAIWLLFVTLPDLYAPDPVERGDERPPSVPESERVVRATLFYVSEDGMQLVGVDREVPHSDDVTTQARRIIAEQLGPAPPPLVSPFPEGTRLRALYLTERGDAFVDLSGEVTTGHAGGSLDELFTVYALVNAVTTNLPAVTAVQILVDGREVDTLAGHVDLRHPLEQNLKWVSPPTSESALDAARLGRGHPSAAAALGAPPQHPSAAAALGTPPSK
jgi:hypothetical protein